MRKHKLKLVKTMFVKLPILM
jgi:hypothetical protein